MATRDYLWSHGIHINIYCIVYHMQVKTAKFFSLVFIFLLQFSLDCALFFNFFHFILALYSLVIHSTPHLILICSPMAQLFFQNLLNLQPNILIQRSKLLLCLCGKDFSRTTPIEHLSPAEFPRVYKSYTDYTPVQPTN